VSGLRVHSDEKIKGIIDEALAIFERVDPPLYLRTVVFNACLNIVQHQFIDNEVGEHDILVALAALNDWDFSEYPEIVPQTFDFILARVSEREMSAKVVLPPQR
jgi:hypothetical protein